MFKAKSDSSYEDEDFKPTLPALTLVSTKVQGVGSGHNLLKARKLFDGFAAEFFTVRANGSGIIGVAGVPAAKPNAEFDHFLLLVIK